jgi:prepilin-type N-terminal cleavage/methylation domain-containing protein
LKNQGRSSGEPRIPAPGPRDNWGFTLIELVVVLFLLSLATGLTLPAVGRGVQTLELRAQVAGFSAFLRYGREQAITKRIAHEVRVDPEGRQLTLIPVGSDSPKARRLISSRIRISADPPGSRVVTFSPQGFSTAASFRLETQGGRMYRVTVDPVTGRVSNTREAG